MKSSMPTIPDFTSGGWQEGVSNAQLTVGILEGKGTLMPAFRERINDARAQDLTAIIRAFGPLPQLPPDGATSDFEKRFREIQAQWYEFQRQLQELSKPSRKQ